MPHESAYARQHSWRTITTLAGGRFRRDQVVTQAGRALRTDSQSRLPTDTALSACCGPRRNGKDGGGGGGGEETRVSVASQEIVTAHAATGIASFRASRSLNEHIVFAIAATSYLARPFAASFLRQG